MIRKFESNRQQSVRLRTVLIPIRPFYVKSFPYCELGEAFPRQNFRQEIIFLEEENFEKLVSNVFIRVAYMLSYVQNKMVIK